MEIRNLEGSREEGVEILRIKGKREDRGETGLRGGRRLLISHQTAREMRLLKKNMFGGCAGHLSHNTHTHTRTRREAFSLSPPLSRLDNYNFFGPPNPLYDQVHFLVCRRPNLPTTCYCPAGSTLPAAAGKSRPCGRGTTTTPPIRDRTLLITGAYPV